MAVAEPFITPRQKLRFWERSKHGFASTPIGAKIALGSVAVVTLVAIFAPRLIPYHPNVPVADPLSHPGLHHLFGIDEVGRDIFSRSLIGLRSSWYGALLVIASGVVFGGTIGLIAGAAGGFIDGVLMRITDIFLALPGAVLAVAVVAALGPSYTHTLLAIAVVWWPLYARIVRAEVRRLKASPHIEAARVAGAGPVRLALRHLLPGAFPATIVAATLDVGALVLTVAALSFLGLGAPSPAAELGSMSQHGLTYLFAAWWVPVMPAVVVAVLVVAANFGGDAVRDRLKDR
jgi:peptide/nickel transport system permease protein